ncbi:MAG: tRNA (adenosine(37)-N6)-dimethylallyltransferase MiaA [Patescibacteria group bacterium]
MKSFERKLIVIVGQTASGKSALAVQLALRLSSGQAKKMYGVNGAEVISADSRQVYRGLDIGSGKITKKEMAGIPHHLLSIANPKKIFTVAQYQKLARKALKNIWRRGKTPIICGGTGFYVQAVVDGIIIPEVKPNILLRKKLGEKTVEELFALLKRKDPERAKNIDPHNSYRLIRALEIIEALGKVPRLKTNLLNADILFIGIKKEKSELRQLIEKRLAKRLKRGLIAEVQKLHSQGLSWARLESFGLEYRYIAQFLQNKIPKETMKKLIIQGSLNYAKRQITWFKRDKKINWINDKKEAYPLVKKFIGK